MRILEVSNLTKRFGGLTAIKDLSLHINKGETLGVIGPNGAGKTTLFNLLTGFIRADSGNIIFEGKEITKMKPHKICERGLTRTFQLVTPFLDLSVEDNITAGALLRNNRMHIAKEKSHEIIKLLNLTKIEKILVNKLPVAKRKLVELGRALATTPKLLLVDELIAGLNPVEVDEAVESVKKIRDLGITICLIEHVMKFIMTLSDRIIVLNFGQKIAEGKPIEISKERNVVEAYLGD